MSFQMKRRKKNIEEEELSFWQSYSDMMAALLLVFVLIIVFTVAQMKETYEEKESKLEEQKIELVQQKNEILKKNLEVEKQNEKIIEYEKKVEEQQGQLDEIVGVRKEIVRQLNDEFENSNLNISIDSETGAICFDSSILFGYDQYELKSSGRKFLNEFFPKYFDVILDKKVKNYISEVIIEGHTDDKGSYLYNLNLSQKRAFAVAEYCLGENEKMFSNKELESIREIVTANGRSYYELKYDKNGNVDANASRRVEVKFRLTEEDMISQITDILSEE